MLALKIHVPQDIVISARDAAEAAERGVFNCIRAHLDRRNDTAKHRDGMPRSNYWAKRPVASRVEGAKAVVEVGAESDGAALHYYGGIVYPTKGKKALAIPVNPAVWDAKPSEFDPAREKLALAWPKGSTTGTLRDKETGDVYFLLVAKATIKADPTVLPDDNTITSAALAAIEGAVL